MSPTDIELVANEPEGKKIVLDLISEQLDNYLLISELLNISLAYEKKNVFKFFFIYQIIELLIDYVYINEQEQLVNSLIHAKGDSGKTKDELEKLNKFMSERSRISLLITNYTNIEGELDQLKSLCNQLLNLVDRKPGDNFAKYFYTIRNFIFHQFRDFPRDGDVILDEIIKETLAVFPTMLSKYKATESF